MTETEWLRFGGTNERATPPMPARWAGDDLELLANLCDSMVVQEFKLRGFWREARRRLSKEWACSPGWARGIAFPVRWAQPIMWHRDVFKKVRSLSQLLHDGVKAISEDRFLTTTFLEHIDTAIRVWHLNTHNVVGGDRHGDGPVRQDILLEKDLPALDRALERRLRGGWPLIGQLDANIARGSAAYDDLMRILHKHGARVVGEHGVEYLFVVDGRKAKVVVGSHSVVKPKKHGGRLWTDHEARLLRYKLVLL